MKEENRISNVQTEPCSHFELLISKSCDGECTPEELAELALHVRGCPACAETLREFREIGTAVALTRLPLACPPVPRVNGRMAFATSRRKRTRAAHGVGRLSAAVLCLLFFAAGHWVGVQRSQNAAEDTVASVSVATPSMWAAGRPVSPVALANIESEQPFTDSIDRYRSAIGMELRKHDVDWMFVRDLVEAMGELRTDLELLTLHMAYLDIRTGSSPYDVASHWEALGKSNTSRSVFKP